MIPYTRVTIVAPSRRAEIVMPSDEPIGAQFPALLSLLGMTAGTELPSLRLVRPNGAILQLEGDLASQRIPDGEILRLVPDDEVPPPAEISDVTGALTAATDVHPWRWKTSDRLLGTGALLLLAGILLSRSLLLHVPDDTPAWIWALPGLVLILFGAISTGTRDRYSQRMRQRVLGAGALLECVGAGLALPPAFALIMGPDQWGGSSTVALVLITAGSLVAVGLNRGGWLAGAVTGIVFLSLRPALIAVSHNRPLTGGALGILALVLLGLLPWLALLISGASRLDDDALAGQLPSRQRVDLVVRRSHDGVLASTLACAVVIMWSTSLLTELESVWPRALASALIVATLLRSRAYPLRLEVLSLWACAVPALLTFMRLMPGEAMQSVILIIVVTGAAILSLYHPAPQSRARLRRLGNRIESLAVVTTLPLLCGLDGMFTRLLGLFS